MPAKIDGGLRGRIAQGIVGPHWQAIETGGTGLGIPDLEGCWGGHSVWIECKATEGWAVGLRPEQIAWLQRRARVGGSSWIAVRRQGKKWWLPSAAYRGYADGAGEPELLAPTRAVDELWLWDGSLASHIAEHGLDCGLRPALYLRAPWNWDAVAARLFPGWQRGRRAGAGLPPPGAPGQALGSLNK